MFPVDAGVAHPVERHLAKVEVASSSLVTRSRNSKNILFLEFFISFTCRSVFLINAVSDGTQETVPSLFSYNTPQTG